ncbi:MAG: hypothetical protein ACK4E8_12060 [Lacibacter sp.]
MKSIVMGLALSFAGPTALAADRQQNSDASVYCTGVAACGESTTMCVYYERETITLEQLHKAIVKTSIELCKIAAAKKLEEIESVAKSVSV